MEGPMDTSNRTGRQAGYPYEVLVPYLSYLSRKVAKGMGVRPEDPDVCERTFVESMIVLNERRLRNLIASGSFGWIRSCARDHARASRRDIQRYRHRTTIGRKGHARSDRRPWDSV